MPFDQSTITRVKPPVFEAGQLWLDWESTSPPGTWFQVYVGRRLVLWTRATEASFPAPADHRVRIDIGAVGPSEYQADFSANLPPAPHDRARLTWQGGTYEADDLASYKVHRSPAAGAAVDYSTAIATVPVYSGQPTDGYGLGGYGEGGYGRAASHYSWTSPALTAGQWRFGVRPTDRAGNLGPAMEVAVSIAAPPQPPARDAAGKRLTYSYNQSLKQVTLAWLASPG